MSTLKVGAKKIKLQPWSSFILISALLWADPIIEKFFGFEGKLKLLVLTKDGI